MSIHRCVAAAVCALAAGVSPAQPCHEGSFAFPIFTSGSDLSLQGSASLGAGELILTPAQEGQSGAAWHRAFGVKITQPWYAAFTFRMNGQADGLAFVIQSSSADQLGGGGSDLGYAGIPNCLAVEFDTFSFSGEFPDDHVSIQTNHWMNNSSGDTSSIAHSVLAQDLNDNQPHEAMIFYDGTTMRVWVDRRLEISAAVDLADGIAGGDGCAFVGFTGATGGVFAEQAITNWSFGEIGGVYDTFAGAGDLALNGSATLAGSVLRLTENVEGQAGSAWNTAVRPAVNEPWTTSFLFRLDGTADGFAFVVQSEGDTALGGGGSGMGYGSNGPPGITHSLAVEFDTFSFSGEIPADHVSIQTNYDGENSSDDGSSVGSAVLTQDLNDGQVHSATISFDGESMSVIVDGSLVLQTEVSFFGIADGNGAASFGFTGGTGAATANQDILAWGFGPQGGCETVGLTEYVFNTDAAAGSTLVLHFAATGTGPKTYVWRLGDTTIDDGGPFSGASTDTLTISPVGPEHAGEWSYAAANLCSSIGSGFTLSVIAACDPDYSQDGNADQDDVAYLINVISGGDNPTGRDPDFTLDGNADQDDVSALINVIAGGPCP